jgi:hypothetical protein
VSEAVPEIVKPTPLVRVFTDGRAPTVPPTVTRVGIILCPEVNLGSTTVTLVAPLAVNVPLTPLPSGIELMFSRRREVTFVDVATAILNTPLNL